MCHIFSLLLGLSKEICSSYIVLLIHFERKQTKGDTQGVCFQGCPVHYTAEMELCWQLSSRSQRISHYIAQQSYSIKYEHRVSREVNSVIRSSPKI